AKNTCQDSIIGSNAEQCEPCNEETGDRPRLEGYRETLSQTLARGLRRPHIGADGYEHADKTGGSGKNRPDQEPNCNWDGKKNGKKNENDRAGDGNGSILPGEIGLSPFLNSGSDLLHAGIAGARRKQRAGRKRAIHDGKRAARDNDPKYLVHRLT